MAQFCINIADEQIGLVIGSMCGIYGYVAMFPNPDPSNHPNPNFNPALPEGADNLRSVPPSIPNPNYNPPATIPNPESAPQFVNRKVREWLSENVKAYQAQVAAEAARQAIINSTNITITDPYI
jgi:hypothetical protein